MSLYTTSSPLASPRNSLSSLRAGSVTPDIIEPDPEFAGDLGGFNLADELAMAENSDDENMGRIDEGESGFLQMNNSNRDSVQSIHSLRSIGQSDYEGSEYGDPDDDDGFDGYLCERVGKEEMEFARLVEELERGGAGVGRFVEELRGMRGQMDVENHARRYESPRNLYLLSILCFLLLFPYVIIYLSSTNIYDRLITMQRSLASALDGHLRLLRDIPVVSPLLLQDDTFLHLLTSISQSLPLPVPISQLLADSSLDLTALSDTLAMTRQDHLQITRKLRSVKDSWIERKSEWDVVEARMLWLKEHDNIERRERGSCAREVQGVVRGFDKVLGGMEREMYISLEGAGD